MTETPVPEPTERRGRISAGLDRLDDLIRHVRVFVGRYSPKILRHAWVGAGHRRQSVACRSGLLGRSLLIIVAADADPDRRC